RTYGERLKAWERQWAAYRRQYGNRRNELLKTDPAAAAKIPYPPFQPGKPEADPQRPAVLYNAMIAPLRPFALKGVAWYQGESNTSRAFEYQDLLTALIKSWRRDFRCDFIFLIVQITAYEAFPGTPPGLLDNSWAWVREAQRRTAQSVPGTGMVVTIDVGERNEIHPGDKQTVGRRLALAARALAYGEKLDYTGPGYTSMTRRDGRIGLTFKRGREGLAARGDGLEGFTIAGADERFVPAQAVIDGDTIVVGSDAVPDPVAIRYAWKGWPEGANLHDGAGLPASPFRTDGFADPTRPKAKP
ncbi:MAG: sialate O-acetylesterase, partial [bacterium]|nr:sialate O-acetylesterase [bacterium]